MSQIALLDLPSFFGRSDATIAVAEEKLTNLFNEVDGMRLGILCNMPGGESRPELIRWIKALGLADTFDKQLLVVPSALGYALPDKTAFHIAAAVAGSPLEQLIFVSASTANLAAAEAVGMQTIDVSSAATGGARLLSEIDPDEGPTYILRGRIVTMNATDQIVENGRIIVHEGRISAILGESDTLPQQFANAPELETGGTIYPGLIDLHNHYAYNVLPLWVVPKKYDNRSQWPRHSEYRSGVSKPINDALAKYTPTAEAIARFVECRALIGGTTTGQGLRTRSKGIEKLLRGAMRNVEETDDIRLPEARSRVPDLITTGRTGPERIERFRRALAETASRGAGYFYHLSEGIDVQARRHFLNLVDHDLIASSLIGIHSLGLKADDYSKLAEKGAKIVWSPFSNLLLYGETLQLQEVLDAGLSISLGCDWTPTGSKNLLQELKVAAFVNAEQDSPLDPIDIVRMVTTAAADVVGWDSQLGQLASGRLADLMVISGIDGDPYEKLLNAIEADISLLTVHGRPRYGDGRLVEPLHTGPRGTLEDAMINGAAKVLALHQSESPINHLTLDEAVDRLRGAMADLPGYVDEQESKGAQLLSLGIEQPEEFTLALDNEFHDDELYDFDISALLMADVPMVDSIELERVWVDPSETNYWQRIEAQPNLSDALKAHLRAAYATN